MPLPDTLSESDPPVPVVDFALVEALVERGDGLAAIDLLRKMAGYHPHDPNILLRLGMLQTALGQFSQAEESLQPLAACFADNDEVAFRYGVALVLQGKLEQAGAALEAGFARGRHRIDYMKLMGRIAGQLRMSSVALLCLETARRLAPEDSGIRISLADVYLIDGRPVEAVEAGGAALALQPDNMSVYSLFCWLSNHIPTWSAAEVATVHRSWAAAMALHLEAEAFPAFSAPESGGARQRLRIGYVSPDLKIHPVAQFLQPVLEHHDRQRFEVWLYSDTAKPDAITDRFQTLGEHWVSLLGLDHEQALARIRADQLDILIDLAGHTTGNRLPVFARRAARVQISWLGYPNTTGLATMDYRLTDASTDPAGMEAHHSERLFGWRGLPCLSSDCRSRAHGASQPDARLCYLWFVQ